MKFVGNKVYLSEEEYQDICKQKKIRDQVRDQDARIARQRDQVRDQDARIARQKRKEDTFPYRGKDGNYYRTSEELEAANEQFDEEFSGHRDVGRRR